jgi:hypothetical protein
MGERTAADCRGGTGRPFTVPRTSRAASRVTSRPSGLFACVRRTASTDTSISSAVECSLIRARYGPRFGPCVGCSGGAGTGTARTLSPPRFGAFADGANRTSRCEVATVHYRRFEDASGDRFGGVSGRANPDIAPVADWGILERHFPDTSAAAQPHVGGRALADARRCRRDAPGRADAECRSNIGERTQERTTSRVPETAGPTFVPPWGVAARQLIW